MRATFFLLFVALIGSAGCKKDDTPTPTPSASYGQLNVAVVHEVEGAPLLFDTLRYVNAAGEMYSVTRLDYFVSNLKLYRGGVLRYSADTLLPIDARVANSFLLKNIPSGNYDSLSCIIGLDSAHNIHGNIPQTSWNVAMEWPTMMGGGYHFIKLEGHWKDGNNTPGYAMHIGKNEFLVKAGKAINITLEDGVVKNARLIMNLNEWYTNPMTYSFATDGVYSMGNMSLMMKLKNNGADVLTLKH